MTDARRRFGSSASRGNPRHGLVACATPSPRHPASHLVGALIALVMLAGSASADSWDDPKLDVELDIPGAPAAWTWLKPDAGWQALGIVRGATRVLAKSESGTALTGVGGQMHLAVRNLPGRHDSRQGAERSRHPPRSLLKRFGATKPTLEEELTMVAARKPKLEHPAAVLRATGVAPGLAGGSAGKPCYGSLLITIARGRLYLMRTYAFTTPGDAEGLALDVDFMEGNALGLLDTTPLPKLKKAPPQSTPAQARADQVRDAGLAHDEARQARARHDRPQGEGRLPRAQVHGWGQVRRLRPQHPCGASHGAHLADSTWRSGSRPPWWKGFTAAHPTGAISTFAWPTPGTSRKPTFLTLPDLGDTSKLVKVLGAGGKKGRKQLDDKQAARLIKKTKCCGPAKMRLLGTKGRVSSVVRGILHGTNKEGMSETVVRVAWRSKTHTYMVFLVVTGEGWKKWGAALRASLESIEFGVKK